MMPWYHGWACSSPLIASHIHIEHTYCVFSPFNHIGRHISLAGNVNIFDVFKRLILKTCLRVVPMCQPDTAKMSPTLQLLMVFLMSHVMSCCWLLTCWQCNNQPVRERCDERGRSAMRKVLAAAMQQRTTRQRHWVVAGAVGNGDGSERCRGVANITICQT